MIKFTDLTCGDHTLRVQDLEDLSKLTIGDVDQYDAVAVSDRSECIYMVDHSVVSDSVFDMLKTIDTTDIQSDIIDLVGVDEVLCQLSEECAELAKAANKVRRASNGKNPTPIKLEDAIANLTEEYADVVTCIKILQLVYNICDADYVDAHVIDRTNRWVNRIKEEEN